MKLHLFRELKIGYKILILFQFMMIPTIIIFTALMIVTGKLNELQNRILLENVSSISAAYNIEKALLSMRGLKANYILDGNKEWLNEFDQNVDSFNYWYNESFNSAFTEKEQNILSALSVDFTQYNEYHKKIISLADIGEKSKAVGLLLGESTESYSSIIDKSEEFILLNRKLITEAEARLKKYIERSRYLSYAIIAVFFIFGILLVVMVTRSIVNPIKEIEKESRSVLPGRSDKNEMELLKERFTSMIETLKANQNKMIISERRATIGEIAAGISHELNNPIGIICGFTDILVSKEKLSDDDFEIITDIHREALRCKKLLKELLDFARTPEPCLIESNMSELINETLGLFRNQDRYRDIRFFFSKPESRINLLIDPFQIKQVLLNFILNACDAVEYKGDIHISIQRMGGDARMFIRDSGKGIKKENFGKIFTPFFTTKADGVGLGLAICRDIIEKHNGSITVNSEPGNGAEFIITLPGGIYESE